MPMVAWYMLSKESYMKRVIKDVLPTFGSGTKESVSQLDSPYSVCIGVVTGQVLTALLAQEDKPRFCRQHLLSTFANRK